MIPSPTWQGVETSVHLTMNVTCIVTSSYETTFLVNLHVMCMCMELYLGAANGMTTDVYSRENCIVPDMSSIV